MEKISRIVRGNQRVAAVDLKNAAPVRPGTPSFGRPVGESTALSSSASTTASRAVALHNEIVEQKKANSQERIVQNMADQFFMSRMRRPDDMTTEESISVSAPAVGDKPPAPAEESTESEPVATAPQGYTPRGSFVDVRA